MTVGEQVSDGHKYWKMRISTIHEDDNGRYWIVGDWFYAPGDMDKVELRRQ
jgi:hypothetical protein